MLSILYPFGTPITSGGHRSGRPRRPTGVGHPHQATDVVQHTIGSIDLRISPGAGKTPVEAITCTSSNAGPKKLSQELRRRVNRPLYIDEEAVDGR